MYCTLHSSPQKYSRCPPPTLGISVHSHPVSQCRRRPEQSCHPAATSLPHRILSPASVQSCKITSAPAANSYTPSRFPCTTPKGAARLYPSLCPFSLGPITERSWSMISTVVSKMKGGVCAIDIGVLRLFAPKEPCAADTSFQMNLPYEPYEAST